MKTSENTPYFIISITIGLVLTCLAVPSIMAAFEHLYISGVVKAGSPCMGGLAMLLTIPMKIISICSVCLVFLLDAVSIMATFLVTQSPLALFLLAQK